MTVKIANRKTTLECKRRNAPKTHYIMVETCANCETRVILTIPKGIGVQDFIKNLNCPYCQCPMADYLTHGFDCGD